MSEHYDHNHHDEAQTRGEGSGESSANGRPQARGSVTDEAGSVYDLADSVEQPSGMVDDDPWAEEAVQARPGLFARGRARFRSRWDHYLQNALPRDDDAPAGLPKFLHGRRGRLVLGAASLCVVLAWTLGLVWILF